MFPCLRYHSNEIPYTFRQYHCSSTSIPITTSSIVFAARIHIFDRYDNNIVISACSVRKGEIDSDSTYFTGINGIFGSIPTFCKISLSASIVLASIFNQLPSLHGKRILRL